MADYIQYANQGATRNQPLSNDLVRSLGYLADLGVTAEVFSGGQPTEGPNRVGSRRHDHGGAADVFFYRNGRRLDWSNPDDLPIFQEIVRRGRANGLTGFGAGDNYMQPGSMHIGFGPEAVWGAEGRGANAPDWLRAAYYGAEAGSVPQGQPSQPQYVDTSGLMASQNALSQAPQMTPEQIDRAQRLQALSLMPQQEPNQLNAADFMRPTQNALAPMGFGSGQSVFT